MIEYKRAQIHNVHMNYAERLEGASDKKILLVHGIPTSSYLYRNVQRSMGPGFHTVAPDLPGYGRSDKPSGFDYGLENLSYYLEGFKTKVFGSQKIHLVIHDIGGPIGLGWLLKHQNEVRSLTILNTTVFLEHFRPPLAALVGVIPILGERIISLANGTFFEGAMRREFKSPISSEELSGYVMPYHNQRAIDAMAKTFAAYPRSLKFIQNIRQQLTTIKVPTQIIFGGADSYCVPSNGQAFADAVPNSKFKVLDGVGHFVPEEVPELLAADIMDLASGTPSAAMG